MEVDAPPVVGGGVPCCVPELGGVSGDTAGGGVWHPASTLAATISRGNDLWDIDWDVGRLIVCLAREASSCVEVTAACTVSSLAADYRPVGLDRARHAAPGVTLVH